MAQSPNTQEVKNPFTSGNQQSAGEQRGGDAQAPGAADNKGVDATTYKQAEEAGKKLGLEGDSTREQIESNK